MVAEKKLNKFEEYKYAFLVGGGALITIILLTFLIGRPLWNQYRAAEQTLKEKRAVLAKLEDKLNTLKELKNDESSYKKKNEKVLAALPLDKDVSRLFVQFENIANQNGVTISSVSESGMVTTNTDPQSQSQTTEIIKPLSYTVNGTSQNYASLKNALRNLENALRILNISKLDINSGNEGGLQTNFTITTYARTK